MAEGQEPKIRLKEVLGYLSKESLFFKLINEIDYTLPEMQFKGIILIAVTNLTSILSFILFN